MAARDKKSEGIAVRGIGAGVGYALVLGLILGAIGGIIVFLTPVSENLLPFLASIISLIAVFWGARHAGRLAGSKGLIHGLLVGLFYAALLTVLASLSGNFSGQGTFTLLLYTVIAGSLGGIVGVSLNRR